VHFPSLQQAEAYLRDGAERNPGPWVAHSRLVAQGARLIAEHHPGLDPESAYIVGLLHDIGRRFGVAHMKHALDGYTFLMAEGFPSASRISLTHSFPDKTLPSQSTWDGTPEEYCFFMEMLASFVYDPYDRLIQLMDCLALPDGFCLMEKRFVDVTLRYGFNDHTTQRWKAYFAVKKEIETALGFSVYRLLPGIVETSLYIDLYEPSSVPT
jgi:hypothetical protein